MYIHEKECAVKIAMIKIALIKMTKVKFKTRKLKIVLKNNLFIK